MSQFGLKYSHTLGIAAMEGRGFSNPVDLTISSAGRIYVLSRTNPAQTYGIRVGICNLESDYFGDFGAYGSGDGEFIWPTALASDRDDNVYLADEFNHRITAYDSDGAYLHKWGGEGRGDGQIDGPSGLVFDANGDLYVADSRNHRVQKFTPDGGFVSSFGAEGSEDGRLTLPWGLATSVSGDVYVADWGNDRVQVFSAEGEFIASYGSSGDGQLRRPSSVAVDPQGYIYVADWGNERVQVLDPDGGFVLKLRGEATLSKWADEFYEANPDEKAARQRADLLPKLAEEVDSPYEESARIERYFWGPASVKLDNEGRLYVTETNRHRVQVYERVLGSGF